MAGADSRRLRVIRKDKLTVMRSGDARHFFDLLAIPDTTVISAVITSRLYPQLRLHRHA